MNVEKDFPMISNAWVAIRRIKRLLRDLKPYEYAIPALAIDYAWVFLLSFSVILLIM